MLYQLSYSRPNGETPDIRCWMSVKTDIQHLTPNICLYWCRG